MDSDKFGDPRTRSERGRRGRGSRGRGRGQISSSGARGRGRGRGGRGGRGGSSVGRNEKMIEKLESNAFRFETYDEIRMTARRDGITTDTDLYEIKKDENENVYEDEEEQGQEREIDIHVADGEDDEQDEIVKEKITEKIVITEFTSVAKVLAEAPIWATTKWEENGKQLKDLITEECELDDNKNEDVDEIMNELKQLDVDEEEINNQEQNNNNQNSDKSATKRDESLDVDDDFDRWLDEV